MPVENCSSSEAPTPPGGTDGKASNVAESTHKCNSVIDRTAVPSCSGENKDCGQQEDNVSKNVVTQNHLVSTGHEAERKPVVVENGQLESNTFENGMLGGSDDDQPLTADSLSTGAVCQHRNSSSQDVNSHVLAGVDRVLDNENNRGDDDSESYESEESDEFEGEDFTDEFAEFETDEENEEEAQENVPPCLGDGYSRDSLAGPDRNRRRLAGRHRQEAQRIIGIRGPILERWRQIGAQWGLSNDGDIARLLLQHYEDIQAGRPPRPPPAPQCLGCGERLVPAPCEVCGPNMHSQRLSNERGGGGGGSGGGGGVGGGGVGGGGFGGGGGGGGGGFGGFSGDRYCGRCRD